MIEQLLSAEEIQKNITDICEASLVIKSCVNDNQYLCDILNSIDKNYVGQYYRQEKSGVVINIRKEVAKNILLEDITPEVLVGIIKKHKSQNPQKLKAWTNPYKIIHPFVNQKYESLDNFIIKFSKQLKELVGGVKVHIVNFDGAQYQGTEHYWLALYNENHSSQSDGLQLFFQFYGGKFTYGIYQHITGGYLVGPIEYTSVENIFNFIEENKHLTLEEDIKPKMSFIEAAKFILEQKGNQPMTASDIWSEIYKGRLVKTSGKTPHLTLNSVLCENSCNLDKVSSDNQSHKKSQIFKIVSTDPYKFVLSNYMPQHIKQNLLSNGFITLEMLSEIFKKNGLEFEI